MAEERIFPLNPTDIRLKKDLGADVSVNKYSAHEKLDQAQATSNEILTDTADIQPRLVDVETDVANLTSDVADVQTGVDTANAALANATYGLSALNTDIDQLSADVANVDSDLASVAADVTSIKTNLGTPATGTVAGDVEAIVSLIGDPANGTVSADILEIDSKIDQIQNNTRTAVALNSEFELPATGQTRYVKISLANYDSAGDMKAPDSAPTVAVETGGGASRNANLGDWDGATFSAGTTMLNVSTGMYYIFYRLPYDATPNEQLVFTFTIVEGGNTRYAIRTSYVVEEVSSTFTAADRTTLLDVDTVVTDVQTKIGTPVTSVSADVAAVQSTADDIEAKVDIIDTNVDTIKDSVLPAIQTKTSGTYDRDTMSLEALAEDIAALSSGAVPTIWDAAKTSGSISATGGTETVILTDTEGVDGIAGIINTLIVNPTTSCTDYTVEVFEDSTLNNLIAKVANWSSVKDGSLMYGVNRAFINADAQERLYVKITNDSNTACSFNVKVRAVKYYTA